MIARSPRCASAGHIVMLHKLDNTQYGSIAVAEDKARSALYYRRPSKVFEELVAQGGIGLRTLELRGASPLEGGIPLIVDGKIIGAIDAPIEYNYRNKAELEARNGPNAMEGEEHGLSVFFSLNDDVFHTYSVYARGTESLTDARNLLDTTPYGRQQDFEDSPPGWPQRPTYG